VRGAELFELACFVGLFVIVAWMVISVAFGG
jgi:hypothetical protein